MFFGFDRNLFREVCFENPNVSGVSGVWVFWFCAVSGVGCLGVSGVWLFWGVAVVGEYSRGCSLSLSPIGAGMTGPLSGPVSDR